MEKLDWKLLLIWEVYKAIGIWKCSLCMVLKEKMKIHHFEKFESCLLTDEQKLKTMVRQSKCEIISLLTRFGICSHFLFLKWKFMKKKKQKKTVPWDLVRILQKTFRMYIKTGKKKLESYHQRIRLFWKGASLIKLFAKVSFWLHLMFVCVYIYIIADKINTFFLWYKSLRVNMAENANGGIK